MLRSRLWLTLACLLAFLGTTPTVWAQKHGGTLRVTHRDNPPSASILEEATISTDMPFMAVFNNLIVFDPDSPVTGSTAWSPTSPHPGPGATTTTL